MFTVWKKNLRLICLRYESKQYFPADQKPLRCRHFPWRVSKISEKIMPKVMSVQNRALEKTYPFVFMGALHFKVKDDHQYVTKATYVVLGATMEGSKDLPGIWVGEYESSKFRLGVLNHLKNRVIYTYFALMA